MSLLKNTGRIFDRQLKQRQIWSSLVILVPYNSHHVPKYNQWMKDPNLQYLTGSEPLTLDQEFEMLESWNNDPGKCTFIILDRQRFESSCIENSQQKEVDSMVGDVNIYLLPDNDGDSEGKLCAEIEIMIAEAWARGKGLGKEAAQIMMKFGYEMLNIEIFQAKIKLTNIPSQKLFTNAFSFEEISRSSIFNEITFQSNLTKENNHLKRLIQEISVKYVLDF